jgi:hypothetical protein
MTWFHLCRCENAEDIPPDDSALGLEIAREIGGLFVSGDLPADKEQSRTAADFEAVCVIATRCGDVGWIVNDGHNGVSFLAGQGSIIDAVS